MNEYKLQDSLQKLVDLGYGCTEGIPLTPPDDSRGISSQPTFFTAMATVRNCQDTPKRVTMTIESTYFVVQHNCNESQGRQYLNNRSGRTLISLCEAAGLKQQGIFQDYHSTIPTYPEIPKGTFAVDIDDHRGGKSNVINIYNVAVSAEDIGILTATAEKLVKELQKTAQPRAESAVDKLVQRNPGSSFAVRE